MMLPNLPFLTVFIRRESGPVRCFCPIKSLSCCGRSLSAKGPSTVAEAKCAFVRFAKGFCVGVDISALRFLTTGVPVGSDVMFELLDLVSRLEKKGGILLVESPTRRD